MKSLYVLSGASGMTGSELVRQILEAEKNSRIIGFASSWGGAHFKGAIGSKFYIDNAQLFCE